ncbi:hypothetical protein ADUPG1_013111, partial [Aduncisulcus paluster]
GVDDYLESAIQVVAELNEKEKCSNYSDLIQEQEWRQRKEKLIKYHKEKEEKREEEEEEIFYTTTTGDVLVFVTGQEEVESAVTALKEREEVWERKRERVFELLQIAKEKEKKEKEKEEEMSTKKETKKKGEEKKKKEREEEFSELEELDFKLLRPIRKSKQDQINDQYKKLSNSDKEFMRIGKKRSSSDSYSSSSSSSSLSSLLIMNDLSDEEKRKAKRLSHLISSEIDHEKVLKLEQSASRTSNSEEALLSGDSVLFSSDHQQTEWENNHPYLAANLISQTIPSHSMSILPLYAALPYDQQMRVFTKEKIQDWSSPGQDWSMISGKSQDKSYFYSQSDSKNRFPNTRVRRVIIATNIAETSLTISGIRYVVETGVAKIRNFSPKNGVETLSILPISRASVRQRSGRAGREAPGVCYHLYTRESYFNSLPPNAIPEIVRAPLTGVLLVLIGVGIHTPLLFPFLSSPSGAALSLALKELLYLKAIKIKPCQVEVRKGVVIRNSLSLHSQKSIYSSSSSASASSFEKTSDDSVISSTLFAFLTPLGKSMVQFPLSPSLSRTLIAGHELGCLGDVLSVISLLSVDHVWVNPTDEKKRKRAEGVKRVFFSPYGDHITLLNLWLGVRSMIKGQKKKKKKSRERKKRGRRRSAIWEYFKHKTQEMVEQLYGIAKRAGLDPNSSYFSENETLKEDSHENGYECVLKAFCAGSAGKLAILQDIHGDYKIINGITAKIHPSSCLRMVGTRAKVIMFHESVETSQLYLRTCSRVEEEWISGMTSVSRK